MGLTAIILWATIALLMGYDAFTVIRYKNYKKTISATVYSASFEWPIIPFLAGLICGHFFFSVRC